MTIQVGLMLKTDERTYLICKDVNGYPDLVCISGPPLEGTKKEAAKELYRELLGNPYPLSQATTRQVLWDLLEASLKELP